MSEVHFVYEFFRKHLVFVALGTSLGSPEIVIPVSVGSFGGLQIPHGKLHGAVPGYKTRRLVLHKVSSY